MRKSGRAKEDSQIRYFQDWSSQIERYESKSVVSSWSDVKKKPMYKMTYPIRNRSMNVYTIIPTNHPYYAILQSSNL